MPNALIQYMGYLIYFWGGDGSEPVHVHVSKSKQKNATKFWVTSEGIELANDTGSVDKRYEGHSRVSSCKQGVYYNVLGRIFWQS